jgi:VWFA-related protein
MRVLLLTLLCGLLAAQQTTIPPQQPASPQQPPAATADEDRPIRTTVTNVVAQVLVFDRGGGYVNNIRKDQFRLFDNETEQDISVDVTYTPISLVLLIQSNAQVEGLLPQVNKIGNLIGPQVIGDAGETAVIAYDHRVRTLQEFTSDSDMITQAVKKIQPGSQSNRMVDAVMGGVRLLASRPRNRRRIMLLIGETRDMGSETRTRDALVALQMNNVEFYSVDMSRFITTLTAPARVGRPDPLPPAMRPVPPNVPATPTTVQQTFGTNGGSAQFIPLFVELFRDAKAVFKSNPVELFTKGTGGTEFGFHSQRTLETALTAIGEQLHSQYTITYSPNNKNVGGWHTIQVQVAGHPGIDKVLTRPGYWVGPQ